MSRKRVEYAFPYPRDAQGFPDGSDTGMSLREYMAAQALTGLLAQDVNDAWESYEAMCDRAWRLADMMLERRHK